MRVVGIYWGIHTNSRRYPCKELEESGARVIKRDDKDWLGTARSIKRVLYFANFSA